MNDHRLLAFLTAAAVLGLCTFAYWPGLYGPWLFDDIPNLSAVQQWVAGATGWRTVVFENLAGRLGRPISMATFLIDGSIWGMETFGFKLGNLLLHLVTGIAIFFLVKPIAERGAPNGTRPALLAAAIATIWLLHPIQAGTVLYIIQRMAMLSALFIVLAMLAYMIGRTHLEAGRTRRGAIWIFIGVPLLTLLAAFSKENGLLAPLLCGVIEWAWFRPAAGMRRPPVVQAFLLFLVAAPIFTGLVLLILRPELFLAGYGNRHFNLVERLLTESRVLFDYAGKLLWPGKFSLFRDDYTISTSLVAPPITALALLGWLSLVTAAIRLRRRLPLFSGGIAIFLAAHAMESSVFPLMIYFEHRNYLPSLGIFLAVAGLVMPAWQHLKSKMDHPGIVATAGLVGLFCVLVFATHGRALVWQTKERIVLESLHNYPDSRFIRTEMAKLEMNRPIRRPHAAREYIEPLLDNERELVRMIGELTMLKIDCISNAKISQERLAYLFDIIPATLEADLVMSHRGLIEMSKHPPCSGLSAEVVADQLSTWLGQLQQPEASRNKARLRLQIAKLYQQSGRYQDAVAQARLSQESGLPPVEAGLLIASLYTELNDFSRAASALNEIKDKVDPGDKKINKRLNKIRETIQRGSI